MTTCEYIAQKLIIVMQNLGKAKKTSLERPNMGATPEEPDRLKVLNKKILLAKATEKNSRGSSINQTNMSYVWRMVLELVIGMLFGFGIGFGLDKWLGTAPFMMIIMSLFGFAAGIKTMMVTANEFSGLSNKNRPEE